MKTMEMPDRIARYKQTFPLYPAPQLFGQKLYGVWLIGNFYGRINSLWGSYPHSYLKRLYALFPETPRLHVFSGLVRDPESTTFDINPAHLPDVVGDVLNAPNLLRRNFFRVVVADPPYDRKAQEIYGTPPLNKRLAICALHEVIEPGGFLLWLDKGTPIWSKKLWKWGGLIAVHTGTNCILRALSIFQKREK